MTNNISEEQLQSLQDSLDKAEPVVIGMSMRIEGFNFIISELRILDRVTYAKQNGITIVSKEKLHSKFQARLVYSDNSSKLINLREKA